MPPVIKPKSDYSNAHWTRGEVRYAPMDGRKSVTAIGLLFGPWGVVKNDEDFVLVHLRSGIWTVRNLRSEVDACRIGDWMWKQFPLVLRLATVDEMRERLGVEKASRINAWLKDCGKTGQFVPPPAV